MTEGRALRKGDKVATVVNLRRGLGAVAALMLVSGCGGEAPGDSLVAAPSGAIISHDTNTPIGSQLHHFAPSLVLRKGATPIHLDAISYVDAPSGVEVAPAICFDFKDTAGKDVNAWDGQALPNYPQAVPHAVSSVVVDSDVKASKWCGLTVIPRQQGKYMLQHIRIYYHDTSGKHEQDYDGWGLGFFTQ